MWVGEAEVKVILQNNGMEAFIPQVRKSGSIWPGVARGGGGVDSGGWRVASSEPSRMLSWVGQYCQTTHGGIRTTGETAKACAGGGGDE